MSSATITTTVANPSHYVSIHNDLAKDFGKVTISSPKALDNETKEKVVRTAYLHLAYLHFGGFSSPPEKSWKELREAGISYQIIAFKNGRNNIRWPAS